ncbi:hypothetical protein [Nocardioides sp.]
MPIAIAGVGGNPAPTCKTLAVTGDLRTALPGAELTAEAGAR